MANITINEVSKSYVYDIANSNYATVAMPITSMWGPGIDYDTVKGNLGKLDQYSDLWQSFNATQEGIEAFARAYRGASSLYRIEKDYSYQMALTLLASGYNVSTIRITQGGAANLFGNINLTKYFDGTLVQVVDTQTGEVDHYERVIVVADNDSILKLFNSANNGKTFEIGGIFGDTISQATATIVDGESATFTLGENSNTITIKFELSSTNKNEITITLTVSASADATWDSVSVYTWNEVSDKTWDGLGGNNPTVRSFADVLAENGVASGLVVNNNSVHLVITNPKEGTADAPVDDGVYYIATIAAKYAGTFGNRLIVDIRNNVYGSNGLVWNATTYILQDNGGIIPAESINFVLNYEDSTDTLYYIDEISDYSEYIGSISLGNLVDLPGFESKIYDCRLAVKEDGKGTDYNDDGTYGAKDLVALVDTAMYDRGYDNYDAYFMSIHSIVESIVNDSYILTPQQPADWTTNYTDYYTRSGSGTSDDPYVYTNVPQAGQGEPIPTWAANTYYELPENSATDARYLLDAQQKFTAFYFLLDMLKDKLSFSPQFIISGGWDDMCVSMFENSFDKYTTIPRVAPFHSKLMEVAYYSRCSCALIDIPRDIPIDFVKTENSAMPGYVEKLSQQGDALDNLYATHSALFTPWGRYTYVSMNRPVECAPSIEYLLIERAMIKNQATQYYWCLPTTRSHRLSFGKLDYKVSKSYLDSWQKNYGPDLNVITNIPSLGLSLWGNSTLYNTPVATYQALANLSTRLLVNAVEDLVYKCGIAITYQYNNDDAYSSFVAGVTPLLDTMVNVGAIDDYYVRMAAGINGLDSVKANEVVGLIYLVINGVINDITVDLVCLPAGTDLDQYRV